MVLIPPRRDPTLAAIDEILERNEAEQPKRTYLGASSIGDPCARKLWYRLHTEHREIFDAATIKRFKDGHRSEDVMADYLRLVPGVQLWTHDPETGEQYGFEDGGFSGHYDGIILGLLQAPETPHIWEHKAVNEKSYAELNKLINADEKTALRQWNNVYYAQAIINMHKEKLERHYMTISTPGVRDFTSCRTNADPAMAEALIAKAKRIIASSIAPERIGKADYFLCKMCGFYGICQTR